MRLFNRDISGYIFLDPDDSSDDDEDWEDNMDLPSTALDRQIKDHDRETRARCDRGMKSWAERVGVSVGFDLGAH